MKKISKKRISFLLSMLLAVMLFMTSGMNSKAAESDVTVTIFHTNDMHASVEGIGYAKALKDSVPNSILVDGGDATQGTALATFSEGSAIISLMNEAGYDGMVLGNHEFDYGLEVLLENARYAEFPMISANTKNADGIPLLAGIKPGSGQNFILERNGKKIGFFGLTSEETAYKTNPDQLHGIVFEDVVTEAKAHTALLKSQGCDLIVALAHIGVDESTLVTSEKIAEQVEGIDLILDGHSHTEFQKVVNGTTILQTGTKLANIGQVDITFKENGSKKISTKLWEKDDYKKLTPDVVCTGYYTAYIELLEPILSKVIGETTTGLLAYAGDGARVCRLEETVMGDLVADSMLLYGKEMVEESANGGKGIPVVAMQNGGGVRADINAGEITYGEVMEVLPYNNTLGARMITPSKLYALMENGVSALSVDENGTLGGLDGSYPQVAGMRLVIDLSQKAYNPERPQDGEGNRVAGIYLMNEDGSETLLNRMDHTSQIAIVSNSFEISGGDGYILLKDLPFIAESSELDCDILAAYLMILAEDGPITFGPTQSRVVVLQQNTSSYQGALNMAEHGILAGTPISYSVDGEKYENAVAGMDGILVTKEIPAGAHTIDVKYANEILTFFTSNLSGVNVK